MKLITRLSLLTVALALAGCNETISPELQKGNSSNNPDSPVAIPPSEYYFSIVDTSDKLLNYKLHKTGSGNATKKCEVRNTVGLSSDLFRGDTASNDITCFFEAEELSLFHSGFKFEIQASQNTCNFVGYAPFGFYYKQPGDSSGNYDFYTCGETVNDADVAAHSGVGASGCGDYLSKDIGAPVPFKAASHEKLCRYRYKDVNCDTGLLQIREWSGSRDPDTLVVSFTPNDTEIDCGGDSLACIEGPIKDMTSEYSRFTEVADVEINKEFKKQYSYPGLIGTYNSNMKYANFRRNLSSRNIQYISVSDPGYNSHWDPSNALNRIFEPSVMNFFSSNRMFDQSILIDPSANENLVNYGPNMQLIKSLAADPFLGISDRTDPFYTFYCFDYAFDIKARIRMVVRDWDRIFPTTSSDLELLSDLNRNGSARQDLADVYAELPDDNDSHIKFNDLADWDDLIPMSRSLGPYNPATTVFTPQSGWFNNLNFPGDAL